MERGSETVLHAFSLELRECRREAGLSQEELAARADLSARHISFLETGKRQPSLAALISLSRGLGISLAALASAIEARAVAWHEIDRKN